MRVNVRNYGSVEKNIWLFACFSLERKRLIRAERWKKGVRAKIQSRSLFRRLLFFAMDNFKKGGKQQQKQQQ